MVGRSSRSQGIDNWKQKLLVYLERAWLCGCVCKHASYSSDQLKFVNQEENYQTWVAKKKTTQQPSFKGIVSTEHTSLHDPVTLSEFSLGRCMSQREFPTCFKDLEGLK